MTVVDKTDRSQTDAIHFELDLPHAPEKVWRALTDPTLLSQWLLPVIGFSLEPGATFLFKTDPHPGWDGTVSCRMIESHPLQSIRYAWGVPGLDTMMHFTLTPTTSGTLLSIVQSGFKPDQKQNFGGARYGWNMMGTKLVELLAGLP